MKPPENSFGLLISLFSFYGKLSVAVLLPSRNFVCCTILFSLFLSATDLYGQQIIFPHNSNWKYHDQGINLGTAWRSAGYDDGAWPSGTASFGYGDPVNTCIRAGNNCGSDACEPVAGCDKFSTYYFRKSFLITDLASIADFTMNLIRDDGVIVWVNGVDVWRSNITNNNAIYATLASRDIDGELENEVEITRIAASYFVEGINHIAVEVHQSSIKSSDLKFSMELIGNPPGVSQGPYLQVGNQTGITIRWKTNRPLGSRVDLGTTHGSYGTKTVIDPVLKTDHELRIEGLVPETRYFYRIGSEASIFEDSSDLYFFTAPAAGSTKKIKVAVFGDCGINHNGYRSGSIRSYKNYVGENPAELLLLLGDNAYNNGTELEYKNNFFLPMGPHLLRNHVLFPAPGNHDYDETGRESRSGAYYRNFTMPANGESGGIPSGTEAYYSFDWGEIHFISLDSYGAEADQTRLYDTLGPQVSWLKQDLAATNKKWKIVYWHHPPFTKGTRNSDTEEELVRIRQNFIRILERNGVDMVLCGHSHNYERSYLLKGYYESENDFQKSVHTADSSSGRYDGSENSCPYLLSSGKVDHGTVYVVSGSAGADGTVQAGFPHDAMPFAFDDGGMFYFEVEGNRLDARFLRKDLTVADQFTIMKDVSQKSVISAVVGEELELSASWLGTYNWSNGGTTTRTNSFTPPTAGNYEIYAYDQLASPCISDTFIISASGAMPVRLLRYEAIERNGEVNLQWETASELNNHSFIIERSSNALSYQELGRIRGRSANGARYSYIDREPQEGENFYRLSQRDEDGRLTLLGIRSVKIKSKSREIQLILPSDLTGNSNGKIRIQSGRQTEVQISIFDNTGKLVYSKARQLLKGMNEFALPPGRGIHIVRINTAEGLNLTGRYIMK